ncbi:MAG TPA: PKD domain-containing protein, partial [Candidatus Thermoplasmatota archaeon]|nr:PKD domain-containing protein [Candidatus Thermoplasmatota archaeon]
MESRAAGLAALFVVAAALAGCTGGGDQAPPTSTAPPSPHVAFTWAPGSPGAGESVVFEPHLRIVTGTTVAAWSWDFGDGGSSVEPTPSHTYAEPGAYTITLDVTASNGGSGSAVGDITVVPAGSGSGSGSKGSSHGGSTPPRDDPDDPPVEPPPPPLPASTFACPDGLVNEAFATHGQAEGPEGRLAWAALRTGFRFVAVWESSGAEVGALSVSVNGGPWQERGDASARSVHAFVLDDLPTGGFLCFRAS